MLVYLIPYFTFVFKEKQLDEKEEADILSWENIIKENYLVKQTRNQNQSVNEQVKCTLEK